MNDREDLAVPLLSTTGPAIPEPIKVSGSAGRKTQNTATWGPGSCCSKRYKSLFGQLVRYRGPSQKIIRMKPWFRDRAAFSHPSHRAVSHA